MKKSLLFILTAALLISVGAACSVSENNRVIFEGKPQYLTECWDMPDTDGLEDLPENFGTLAPSGSFTMADDAETGKSLSVGLSFADRSGMRFSMYYGLGSKIAALLPAGAANIKFGAAFVPEVNVADGDYTNFYIGSSYSATGHKVYGVFSDTSYESREAIDSSATAGLEVILFMQERNYNKTIAARGVISYELNGNEEYIYSDDIFTANAYDVAYRDYFLKGKLDAKGFVRRVINSVDERIAFGSDIRSKFKSAISDYLTSGTTSSVNGMPYDITAQNVSLIHLYNKDAVPICSVLSSVVNYDWADYLGVDASDISFRTYANGNIKMNGKGGEGVDLSALAADSATIVISSSEHEDFFTFTVSIEDYVDIGTTLSSGKYNGDSHISDIKKNIQNKAADIQADDILVQRIADDGSLVEDEIKNAATYSLRISVADKKILSKVSSDYLDLSYTVTPATLTVEFTNEGKALSKVYGYDDPVWEENVTVKGYVPSEKADISFSRDPGENAGKYSLYLTVSDSNYTIENSVREFEIKKAPYTSAPDYREGFEQFSEVDGKPAVSVEYAPDATIGSVALPAGWAWADSAQSIGTVSDSPRSFNAVFTSYSSNYESAAVTVNVTVNKAKLSLGGASFNSEEVTYDGKEHTLSVDGLDNNIFTVAYSYAYGEGSPLSEVDLTHVTETIYVTATFGFAVNSHDEADNSYAENYICPEPLHATLTINPKSVDVEWSDSTVTYNGAVQLPTATVSDDEIVGKDIVAISVSPIDGAAINVGTYNFTASSANPNYSVDPAASSFTLTVSPCEVDVRWSDRTVTYNGEEQSPYAYVLQKDIFGEDEVPVTVSPVDGPAIDAGKYSFSASCNNANYLLRNTSFTLEITQKTVRVWWRYKNVPIIDGPYTIEYDANEHAPSVYCEDEKLLLGVEGVAGINVGEYAFEAAFTNDGDLRNYNLTNKTCTIKITQATVNFNELEAYTFVLPQIDGFYLDNAAAVAKFISNKRIVKDDDIQVAYRYSKDSDDPGNWYTVDGLKARPIRDGDYIIRVTLESENLKCSSNGPKDYTASISHKLTFYDSDRYLSQASDGGLEGIYNARTHALDVHSGGDEVSASLTWTWKNHESQTVYGACNVGEYTVLACVTEIGGVCCDISLTAHVTINRAVIPAEIFNADSSTKIFFENNNIHIPYHYVSIRDESGQYYYTALQNDPGDIPSDYNGRTYAYSAMAKGQYVVKLTSGGNYQFKLGIYDAYVLWEITDRPSFKLETADGMTIHPTTDENGDNIFNTLTYNGKPYKLSIALPDGHISGYAVSYFIQNGNDVKTSDAPSFTDAGVYKITAKIRGAGDSCEPTATLNIKPQDVSIEYKVAAYYGYYTTSNYTVKMDLSREANIAIDGLIEGEALTGRFDYEIPHGGHDSAFNIYGRLPVSYTGATWEKGQNWIFSGEHDIDEIKAANPNYNFTKIDVKFQIFKSEVDENISIVDKASHTAIDDAKVYASGDTVTVRYSATINVDGHSEPINISEEYYALLKDIAGYEFKNGSYEYALALSAGRNDLSEYPEVALDFSGQENLVGEALTCRLTADVYVKISLSFFERSAAAFVPYNTAADRNLQGKFNALVGVEDDHVHSNGYEEYKQFVWTTDGTAETEYSFTGTAIIENIELKGMFDNRPAKYTYHVDIDADTSAYKTCTVCDHTLYLVVYYEYELDADGTIMLNDMYTSIVLDDVSKTTALNNTATSFGGHDLAYWSTANALTGDIKKVTGDDLDGAASKGLILYAVYSVGAPTLLADENTNSIPITYDAKEHHVYIADSAAYDKQASEPQTDAGTYTFTVALKENTPFVWASDIEKEAIEGRTLTLSWEIDRAPVDAPTWKVDLREATYTEAGTDWTQLLNINSKMYGQEAYRAEYKFGDSGLDNSQLTNAGVYTVTFTPTGNFKWAEGSEDTFTFTITRAEFPMSTTSKEAEYNGADYNTDWHALFGLTAGQVTIVGETINGVRWVDRAEGTYTNYTATATISDKNYIFADNAESITLQFTVTPIYVIWREVSEWPGSFSEVWTASTGNPSKGIIFYPIEIYYLTALDYMKNGKELPSYNDHYTVNGIYYARDIGDYTITISLKDKNNSIWAEKYAGISRLDADIVLNWSIEAADVSAVSISTWERDLSVPPIKDNYRVNLIKRRMRRTSNTAKQA